jgi:CPA2 family monovalent cation:H+ antiporter-2
MISASLAQIGEFSFVLANIGLRLGLIPDEARALIIAGAIITIFLNPLLFAGLDMLAARRETPPADVPAEEKEEETPMREPIRPTTLKDHVVLVGHGRVGSFITSALEGTKTPLFVIEDNDDAVAELKQRGLEALAGNAANPALLPAANLAEARCLLVAIPDAFEGGQVVQQARAINPDLPIIARAHSEEEIEHLKRHGATLVVMGEHEIAKAMLDKVARVDTLAEELAAPSATVQEPPPLAEKSTVTS